MALKNQSLFLYGLQVTPLNSSIDFKAVSGGIEINATLNLGYYSLSGLCDEVARAMSAADPLRTYTCTANRNVAGGLQNRVTISTSGGFLSLLFGSGSRSGSSSASLLGFLEIDYSGLTSYAGSLSTGILLVPEMTAYNYLGPTMLRKIFGSVNVSTSGVKEAVVFQTQEFFQGDWREEPETKVIAEWEPLMTWLISQRPFDFTPDVTVPNTFYNATLETTEMDGQGLGYMMTEMLPTKPFYYKTGMLKFRKVTT